jgi:hypothetical protein
VLGGDLPEAGVVPGEERRPDPAPAVRRVDEAPVPVEERPVRLLIPEGAAVRDGRAVRLHDDEVARRIAALQVRIGGGDALRRLHPVVALAAREGVDDAGHVRVVGLAGEVAECEALELGKGGH